MSTKWVLFFIFGALAAVFTLWGGSLLYRALDGDRFTLQSQVRGRWVNRVSPSLLIMAFVSIVLGTVLTRLTLTMISSGDLAPFLYNIPSVLASLTVVVLAWSWAGRRSAGKPRCPGCGYDVSAVATDTCPECGFVATTEQMWHKPRKRKRGLLVGVLLAVLALGFISAPFVAMYGWQRLVPTRVLISQIESLSDSLLGEGPNRRKGSLYARVENGQLSTAEIDLLIGRIEGGIAEARSDQSLLRWALIANHIPWEIRPEFTPDQADRFIESILLAGSSISPAINAGTLMSIDLSGLDVLDESTSARRASQLVQLASASGPSALNNLRWAAAFALTPDSDSLYDTLIESVARTNTDPAVFGRFVGLFLRLQSAESSAVQARLWEAWLNATDPADRHTMLALAFALRQRGQDIPLSPDLNNRIWDALLDRLVESVPANLNAADLSASVGGSLLSSVTMSFISDTRFGELISAIDLGHLSPQDIAILSATTYSRDKPIPIPALIKLTAHEDPVVRAAAAQALRGALLLRRAEVAPFDDQILQLGDDAILDPLIRDLHTVRVREGLED